MLLNYTVAPLQREDQLGVAARDQPRPDRLAGDLEGVRCVRVTSNAALQLPAISVERAPAKPPMALASQRRCRLRLIAVVSADGN